LIEKLKNNTILPQLVSIALVIFFSVILINAVDLIELKAYAETITKSYGAFGTLIYILINAVLYIFLLPSTVLGASSGVVFGFINGTIVYSISCLAASVFIFYMSRFLFREKIQNLIKRKPHLAEAQNLIENEGIRFLFLIRFLPVHATFINLIFAVSKIKPSKFLLSCLFLLPEWILHVYIGYVASLAAQNAMQQGLILEDYYRIFSLIISIIAITYFAWLAQKIIKKSKSKISSNEKPVVLIK
jgi:uncharacterized membrane protein YdjX (TVP38/TMEM64 family)